MFLGINFVNSPSEVAMPRDNGVTSDDVISVTSPDRIPPYYNNT